jgi:hypothetical protein
MGISHLSVSQRQVGKSCPKRLGGIKSELAVLMRRMRMTFVSCDARLARPQKEIVLCVDFPP